MAFYNATNGDRWKNNSNWMRDLALNEWYGVTADPGGRTVTGLRLRENELVGTLPPELGDLSSLQVLELKENQLQGEIPPELGNLANLTGLDLWENRLRGEIPPELGKLTYLETLSLGANRLQGEIPPDLGNLANLTELHLWGNRLQGPIPPELGNLRYLEVLRLQDNSLEGSIPPELASLASLKVLDLSGNAALNGCMPEGAPVPYCTPPSDIVLNRDGTTAVLAWEAVEGASHYNIYYDDFFSCRGRSSLCDLLVSKVLDTTYTHTGAASDGDNNYGIEACNSDGCSVFGTVQD